MWLYYIILYYIIKKLDILQFIRILNIILISYYYIMLELGIILKISRLQKKRKWNALNHVRSESGEKVFHGLVKQDSHLHIVFLASNHTSNHSIKYRFARVPIAWIVSRISLCFLYIYLLDIPHATKRDKETQLGEKEREASLHLRIIYMRIYMHATRAWMRIYAYIYTHIYLYTYAYIHMRMHIHTTARYSYSIVIVRLPDTQT